MVLHDPTKCSGTENVMKDKFKQAFMDVAERFAQLSSAKRAQVGCIIVKDNRIISIGYNGMPSGWDNECEDYELPDWAHHIDEIDMLDRETYVKYKSKPEVLHAETNAIAKVARSAESCEGADIFCTHLPCIDCAKLIYQSGISKVYYRIEYQARKGPGKDFMLKSGIELEQVHA